MNIYKKDSNDELDEGEEKEEDVLMRVDIVEVMDFLTEIHSEILNIYYEDDKD